MKRLLRSAGHLRPATTLAALTLLLAAAPALAGGLPPAPALDAFNQRESLAPAGQVVAHVALASGAVTVADPAAGVKAPATAGQKLPAGGIIATGADGRCRVEMASGDVLHVGPESRLALVPGTDGVTAQVWQGDVMAYGLPRIEGRKDALRVATARGALAIKAGKALVTAHGAETRLAVFDDHALWTPAGGEEQRLDGGHGLQLDAGGSARAVPAAGDEELRTTTATSPEGAVMTAALKAYQAHEAATAKGLLQAVRKAYPFNAQAAYYLGLIHVEAEEHGEAIRHWQEYAKLDPQGAEEKKVNQHLTVLIAQQMRDEVASAMANEQALSQQPPEPNSVAVTPFANRGEPRFDVLAKGITAMVITDLAKVPGLKVLERAKLQHLLDEMRLAASGLVEEETAARAGKLMRAEKVVVGDYEVK